VSVAPPPRRSYTPADRATAMACLAANAGNVKRTARECGVAHRTVRDWAAAATIDPTLATPAPLTRPYFAPDVAEPFFGPSPAPAMAAELWAVAGLTLAEMRRRLVEEPESIQFRDLVRVWSRAVDKAMLLDQYAAAAGSAPEPRECIDLDKLSLDQLRALREMMAVARVGGGRPGAETTDLDRGTDAELDVLERIAGRARADRGAAGRRELAAAGVADLCIRPPAG